MFMSLSIHVILARTQSSDNDQIGRIFLDGDNDQSNCGPVHIVGQ
jgi:hypothetical protein